MTFVIDLIKLVVLPCVAFGTVWALAFGFPVWAGILAAHVSVGFWAMADLIRGRI